jgi:hypothetical protein
MKITILGNNASMEGTRVIRKEVKVYTLQFPEMEFNPTTHYVDNKVYQSTPALIDKIIGKTFEGQELEDYVEVDLNKVLKSDGI